MTLTRRTKSAWIPILSAAALSMTGAVQLAADSQTTDDVTLTKRVAELESKLAELKASQNDAWMNEARATEIRSIVQDVLSDADTRASLLQDGGNAGWDNGYYFASNDGNFRLNVSGQMQVRYVLNLQDDQPGSDSTRSGFENRRTKLIFNGHVFDQTWLYRIEGNFASSGGGFGLQDAWIAKALNENWIVLAGQVKVPMVREWLVDSSRQQFVERSLVSAEFDAGRTQGIAIDYRNDQFHFTAAYTDGHPATGGFNSPALALDTEYSFTGRAEVLLAGEWGNFDDLSSWKDEEFALLIGGAAHYQDGEYGTAAGEAEVFQWTFDASAEFGGASLFGWVVGRHIEFSSGAEIDQYGVVVQGGYFLNDDWELVGRFEWADDDVSDDDLAIVTVGATRYFNQHQLKWTSDIGFGINSVSGTFGSGLLGIGGEQAGWRTDGTDDDGQVVVRTQLQLLF